MLAFRNEYPLFPIPSAQIEKPVLGSKLSKFSNINLHISTKDKCSFGKKCVAVCTFLKSVMFVNFINK